MLVRRKKGERDDDSDVDNRCHYEWTCVYEFASTAACSHAPEMMASKRSLWIMRWLLMLLNHDYFRRLIRQYENDYMMRLF